METGKEKIIQLFNERVKGKKADLTGFSNNHDGKAGHWLEQQFGIKANGENDADLYGYELKNETTSKTTFGDWSANRYIFKVGHYDDYADLFEGTKLIAKKDHFCQIFGKANEEKNGRYSWSGSPCPKIDGYNDYGQILVVKDNLDIEVLYSYSKDLRPNKSTIVPTELQQENLVIAEWFGTTSLSSKQKDKCIKVKFENKFNKKGWFTCKTNKEGVYQTIHFGKPMPYEDWIEFVKQGVVFFDSGMYEGNKRPYSQWRADNKFWDSLITETY